jgi:RES domain-containing protein
MLEYFVHLDPDDTPDDLLLAIADIPDTVSRERLKADQLSSRWRETPAPSTLAAIGDEFVKNAKHALLIVPSVLSPRESNWLLNPQHEHFQRVVVKTSEPLAYDPRMFVERPRRRTHSRK